MSNDWFRFKQFVIHQDKCAMKVGTDGVLLGAWADITDSLSILDVGTGTGLLSLMCAQRSQADIVAIEIDQQAASQARENFNASPWKDRIKIIREDFTKYDFSNDMKSDGKFDNKFDYIISNPPYFMDSLKSGDPKKNLARHLPQNFAQYFVNQCVNILDPAGAIGMILPPESFVKMNFLLGCKGMNLKRKTELRSRPGQKVFRVLAEWSGVRSSIKSDELIIHETGSNLYHSDVVELTRNFYLDK